MSFEIMMFFDGVCFSFFFPYADEMPVKCAGVEGGRHFFAWERGRPARSGDLRADARAPRTPIRPMSKPMQPQLGAPRPQHRNIGGENAGASDTGRRWGELGERLVDFDALIAIGAGEQMPQGDGVVETRMFENNR